MKRQTLKLTTAVLAVFMVMAACSLSSSDPTPTSGVNQQEAVQTSVAATIIGQGGQPAPPDGSSDSGDSDQDTDQDDGSQEDSPTATATTVPTASPQATPSIPVIHVSVNTNCRYGPGVVYDPPVDALLVGDSAQVIGRNPEGTFYYITKNCYVWNNYVTVEAGNMGSVPVLTPPPTPTLTPTSTPEPLPWEGTWESDCGSANCEDVILAQINDTVTGTYANGDGVISGTVDGNHLNGTWTRNNTSGDIDFWINDDEDKWSGNFDNFDGWCAARPGETLPNPCGTTSWYGTWTTQCLPATCGDLIIEQDGNEITGTYANGDGTITGTISLFVINGTWERGTGDGSIYFSLVQGGGQFKGNYNGTNAWCGHQSGFVDPIPCFDS